MPMLVPTPDELKQIPKHKRERIRRAVLAILTEADEIAAKAVRDIQSDITWGETIRAYARQLEADTQPDPPQITAHRRQLLLEATK